MRVLPIVQFFLLRFADEHGFTSTEFDFDISIQALAGCIINDGGEPL
jgi:hypothetical protein